MTKYIGLTIGPIYETLNNAKKTGALWGSSYIFSYIMKNIIKEFKEREIIVPYCVNEGKEYEKYYEKELGAGVFPDRFIFKSENRDYEKLENIIDKLLNKISESIWEDIQKSGYKNLDNTKISEFLKQYFKIYYLEKDVPNGKNPIFELNKYLDVLELQPKYVTQSNIYTKEEKVFENPLELFFHNRIIKESFLAEDCFKSETDDSKDFSRWIKSIPELASAELKITNPDEYIKLEELSNPKNFTDDNDLEKKIYSNLKKYPKYLKYYAVVQADGDNMGKIISKLNSADDFNNFSKKLFEYAVDSSKLIKEYGGLPIFAGGDDLLFIAPVKNGEKTIFDLVGDIDNRFEEIFDVEIKDPEISPSPSLSYGISINYYKHPLYEALSNARTQLFGVAKEYSGKNAVAVNVRKHSGQTFDLCFGKNKESYKKFNELLNVTLKNSEESEKILNSIKFKLSNEKAIVDEIGKDEIKLKNYFENSFKKDIHKNSDLNKIISYVNGVYGDELKDPIKKIDASLRFLSFLNEKMGAE
ncbi:CRISPR-associated protein, Crm2 family [Methanococcus vannielii SB]|uniref:CRISPR-associated protein, Crm2 family n=1 Tax=Methanococcus vannielii (strain ATCC 35089 / DSM 1224 / JCM 13029 / OCM 148 / SB) TaxID=406327 RepID=A6UNE7_METVS|nr:type III-B CRISPR-associated protein Cas10/Cmr2 [Methanococcus vannielii]ABR54019.1 CRISPR-associated protein, Crm2 family [Methanococcus vannielii SB]